MAEVNTVCLNSVQFNTKTQMLVNQLDLKGQNLTFSLTTLPSVNTQLHTVGEHEHVGTTEQHSGEKLQSDGCKYVIICYYNEKHEGVFAGDEFPGKQQFYQNRK